LRSTTITTSTERPRSNEGRFRRLNGLCAINI
jgi:hypothetical protein